MKTFAAADGLKLAYYVDDFTDPWRTPDTVLLLHAAMGSALRWFNWVPRLARRYRVVQLDLRGHGNSAVPAPEQPFSLAHLTAYAIHWLSAWGLPTTYENVSVLNARLFPNDFAMRGFPDLPELKRLVRDRVAPGKVLGHSER